MKNGFIRLFIALSLVFFGVVLVLENIGIVSLNMKNFWYVLYPTVFVVYGLSSMWNRLRYRGGSWVFGSFIFIFGLLLLFDRFGWMAFKFDDIFKLWPLVIVYLGLTFFNFSGHVFYKKKGKKNQTIKNSGFSIGDYEYNQENWKVQPLYLNNLAGDFYFDFTKAFIPEKETPITIHSLAGDVHILMPDYIEFRVDASVKAGEIDIVGKTSEGINTSLNYETENYEDARRRLDFAFDLKAGSVRIDRIGGRE